jgi:hypothetical protein
MLNQEWRRVISRVRTACLSLLVTLTAAASGGGCTLLVGAQLADKPSEGAGGGGGDPSTGSQSSSAAQSSSSGAISCKSDVADCDGYAWNGCEAHIKSDPKNCGSCKKVCQDGDSCKDGKCQ